MDPRSSPKRPSRGGKGSVNTNSGGRGRGKGTGKRHRAVVAKSEEDDSYGTLGTLVTKATKPTKETGYQHLDEGIVRRIKAIAKQDDHCAAGAIRYLMQRMTAKSSEVRFMALAIVGQLFQRSRIVRGLLVADLKNFMNLAIGHDARQPLPGPPVASAALRQRALALMEDWNEAHGDMYKGLRAAYRFLREGKRMKFPELQARAARERQAAARRDKHAQRLLRAKYLQAKAEIAEQAPEIETIVREMQECFAILVPAVPGTDAISVRGRNAGGDVATGNASPFAEASSSVDGDRVPKGKGRAGGGGGGGGGGGAGSITSPSPLRRDGDSRRGIKYAAMARRGTAGSASTVGDGNGGNVSRADEHRDRGKAADEDNAGGNSDGRGNVLASAVWPHRRENDDTGQERQGQGPGAETGAAAAAAAGAGARARRDVEEDSDDDEGMEWEDDDGEDNSNGTSDGEGVQWEDGEEDEEEEEEEDEDEDEEEAGKGWGEGRRKRRRKNGGARDELRTVADTVEAAGLGSSGYELQVEVPMEWSLTTGAESADAALVVSALRERYKVLTSRLLPLLSDWIQTLSRVRFNVDDQNKGGSNDGGRGGGGERQDGPGGDTTACAGLLSRCLDVRNSASVVVSKFIELKIDVGGDSTGAEAVRRKASSPPGGDDTRGKGSRSPAVTMAGSKKPRLHIRLA